jgi:pSer/pThr/pTyr-binding forkhead associated (FHA) protein
MSIDQDDDRTIVTKPRLEGARQQARPPALELTVGPGAPRRIVLHLPTYVLGRDPNADVTIPSPEISRRHLRLSRVGDEVTCMDLESANGTFLNGVKIHAAVLREGDQMQLGDVVIVFRERG